MKCPICREDLFIGESEAEFYDEDTGEQVTLFLVARWCNCGDYNKVKLKSEW